MPSETVLITGASSGIGLELAKLFAADSSNLILIGRRENRLRELAETLQRQHGVGVRVLAKDLALPSASQEIFAELARDGVEVDVLVNNAGFGTRGRVAEIPAQVQLDMVQVNVAALLQLTLLFLPGMLARGRGGILNVASTAAFQPGPLLSVYYATKGFILSFTEGLAEELRSTNLHVSCLAPGPTRTEFAAVAGMENTSMFKAGTMSAEAVARIGYRAFRKGRVLAIAGVKNQIGAFMVRLAPRWLVRKIVMFLQR